MSSAGPRILVIRRRYIGDIVLLESVFRMLRRHWPAAHIVAAVDPAYTTVLKLHPDVDGALGLPVKPAHWPGFLLRLRREKFTHVLDFDNRPRTALVTLFSGASLRATLRHGHKPRLAFCYTHRHIVEPDYLDDRHITDYYHRLLRSVGIVIKDEPGYLVPLPHEVARLEQLPEIAALPPDTPRLLVHPGSRSPYRIWPAKNFAAVCDVIQRENLARVILSAGPGQHALVEEIVSHMQTPATVIKKSLTLTELAALFSVMDRVLCHDSGPMHLAAAVGTPVVALYGSQNIANWRPLGADHITLQPPLPCEHCVSPGVCKKDDPYFNHCVRNITPERVINALRACF